MNSPVKNRPSQMREFLVSADIAQLNQELAVRGIGAETIVSVIPVAGTRIGAGPGEQFRVLYREI